MCACPDCSFPHVIHTISSIGCELARLCYSLSFCSNNTLRLVTCFRFIAMQLCWTHKTESLSQKRIYHIILHITGWTIGVLGFDFRRGMGIFLFTTASTTALGPTQPPISWVLGVLSLGIKRPGREANQSPSSSAEVEE
jgi:hypothetical protein